MKKNSASSSPLDLASLPTGQHRHRFGDAALGFDAHIWRGAPGPVLLVNGATHGDEYEGPTLLRQWINTWNPADLHGTVILVPILNEAAFTARQRCHPTDAENLARAFPGRADGSPTAQLAHLFKTQLLSHVTHYVDLHSGGHALALHPWVGYIIGSDDLINSTQRAMAACFDAFWCWAGPYLPGRTLSAAFDHNIPAIYTECYGAGTVRQSDLAALDRGLNNLLRQIGCIREPVPPLASQPFHLSTDAEETHLQVHHPAPHAGNFEPKIALAETVTAGQEIGIVHLDSDARPTRIHASRSGTIVLRRHDRSVQRGDALFVIVPL